MFFANNMDLAYQLEIVGISSINKQGTSWQKYFRAADAIRKFQKLIMSGSQAKKLIKYVDYEIAIRIGSFLKSGTVMLGSKGESKLPVLAKTDIISTFSNIYGVDLEKATEWYNLGFHTLDSISSCYMYLTSDQKIGLKYFSDLLTTIDRREIEKYQTAFTYIIRDHKFEICGRYRRGYQQTKAIEVLIKGNNDLSGNELILSKVIGKLIRCKLLTEVIQCDHDTVYCMMRLSDKHITRIVRFKVIIPRSWFTSLVYSTGPKSFVRRLESAANNNNMKLNSHGLWTHIGWGDRYFCSPIPIQSEQHIFTKLSLSYVKPSDRS